MRRLLVLGVAAAGLLPGSAGAATLDPIGTFSQPVFVTSDPADEDRLLVVELAGRIRLHENGATSTFLDLAAAGLVSTGGERGLFSVALAPDYETSHRLYVFYTRTGPGSELGDLQIDEFTAIGDTVPIASRRPVLTVDRGTATNHNGGQLQFGADGYLYIATGDGGNTPATAQELDNLQGKLLRIDPRPGPGGAPYSIPPGNPFAGPAPGADEVWSYGLRNPFRFSFDRAGGDLLLADVGQQLWEEIDYAPAPDLGRGLNWGWNRCEASFVYPPVNPPQPCPVGTTPIHQYPHVGAVSGCSITGGYVSRDPGVAELFGRYVYSDLCAGQIRSLVAGLPAAIDDRSEGLSVGTPGSFGEDSCGRLYVTSLATGQVFRLVGAAGPTDCAAPPPQPPQPGSPAPAGDDGAPPAVAKPRCGGRAATIVAENVDRIAGSRGRDVIVGTNGDDEIRAAAGADRVCGRGGADVIRGGRGADELRGGRGNDLCRGGPGADRLRSC